MNMKPFEQIKETIDYVMLYVGTSSNDYLDIRKEIINNLRGQKRSLFKRRHESSRKIILHDLDQEIIDYWEKETGVQLFINENKLHPKDWVYKPRGWWISTYNEQKRKNKEKLDKSSSQENNQRASSTKNNKSKKKSSTNDD